MHPRPTAVVILVAWFGLTCVARADDASPEPPAVPFTQDGDDSQDLLFLAPERAMFVRLHLRMDGRSFRSSWLDFIGRMFHEIDYNGDGLLTGDEWERVPSPDLLIEGNARGSPQGADSVRVNIDLAPPDGLVTVREFSDYLFERGGRGLSLQALAVGETFGGTGISQGAATQLFPRLDGDGDGKLSAGELAAAPRALARIDFDNDGAVSLAELRSGRGDNPYIATSVDPRRIPKPAEFIELSDVANASLARRLLDRYDRPGSDAGNGSSTDDRLSREELPLPPEEFGRLDANADGTLDFDELQGVAQQPRPELIVTVRVGMRDEGQPAVEVERANRDVRADVRALSGGRIGIVAAGAQLEIACDSADAGDQMRQLVRQQFKAGDADNNNYLERNEARRTYFGQTFDNIDMDGDGKLFEREILEYVGRHEAAARSRCLMGVADEGRTLFEVLDTNRDGRVGPRELLTAVERLAEWDRDKDGFLAEQELPTQFRVMFGRAQPNIPGLPIVPSRRGPNPSGAAAAPRSGPAWFLKMDRNRDGDVSRREFLGPRAAFDRLDSNHDGLIDAEEAGNQ